LWAEAENGAIKGFIDSRAMFKEVGVFTVADGVVEAASGAAQVAMLI
jgi:hypothetical protein